MICKLLIYINSPFFTKAPKPSKTINNSNNSKQLKTTQNNSKQLKQLKQLKTTQNKTPLLNKNSELLFLSDLSFFLDSDR